MPMVCSACGHLRAMGDDQYLAMQRQTLQTLAHRIGNGAADDYRALTEALLTVLEVAHARA